MGVAADRRTRNGSGTRPKRFCKSLRPSRDRRTVVVGEADKAGEGTGYTCIARTRRAPTTLSDQSRVRMLGDGRRHCSVSERSIVDNDHL
jgi:hypothetical protein